MVTSVISCPRAAPPSPKSTVNVGPYQNSPGGRNCLSLVHRVEELLIRLRSPDLIMEELHRLDRIELREQLAQDPDPVQDVAGDEKLFLARARASDVHGGEH